MTRASIRCLSEISAAILRVFARDSQPPLRQQASSLRFAHDKRSRLKKARIRRIEEKTLCITQHTPAHGRHIVRPSSRPETKSREGDSRKEREVQKRVRTLATAVRRAACDVVRECAQTPAQTPFRYSCPEKSRRLDRLCTSNSKLETHVSDRGKGQGSVVGSRDGARLPGSGRQALQDNVLATLLGLLLGSGVGLDAVQEVCSDKACQRGAQDVILHRDRSPSRHLECLTCSMRRLTRFSM